MCKSLAVCSCAAFVLVISVAVRPRVAVGEERHPPTKPHPPPPQANDHHFVRDEGTGLDTLSAGTLEITLPVKRYLGPTTTEGTLQNAQQLVQDGLLEPFATLRLPAWDVDNPPQPGFPYSSRNIVYFNGVDVRDLHPGNPQFLPGPHDDWRTTEYLIPIEKIKFPAAPGQDGNTPADAANVIKLVMQSQGGDLSTQVAWVALEFKCMSPIILIHGQGNSAAWWDKPGRFARVLTQLNLPWAAVDMAQDANAPGCAPREKNADTLNDLIPVLVRGFGADSVHLVAHSKGGGWTRATT